MSSSPSDKPPKNDNKPPSQSPGNQEGEQPRRSSMPWVLIILGLTAVMLMAYSATSKNSGVEVGYSFFKEQVKARNVESIVFSKPDTITGKWKKDNIPENPNVEEGTTAEKLPLDFYTIRPPGEDRGLDALLTEGGVKSSAISMIEGMWGKTLMIFLGPVLIIGFFWFMMRRSSDQMGGGGMFGGFGKSTAKRYQPSDQIVTFDDVAAMKEAKRELQELVEFLKTPDKFQRLGAQIPKGVLLKGSPGTGKTLVARATAGESGVPFFSINGSEFIQLYVGVGASRVRDLFKTAREAAPCIIFIDEIDAIGRMRGTGVGGGSDEREQTLNQILSEMDGFDQSEAVIVMAATNRPDILDPALLRPGRFDRHVTIDKPTKEGRFRHSQST